MLAFDDDLATNGELPAPSALHLRLLGGFRAERTDLDRPVSGWKRHSAKTLTKLLAAQPEHALHREQILEILWPRLDLEPALNSFGKALHAARRALEPELLPRTSSRYLHLSDSMLSLDPDWVAIDADRFQHLAESALRRTEIDGYEAALRAYGGELLPEDRYEDWCAERRDALSELQIRLLVGLAEALEKNGIFSESADRLRDVLEKDPTREEVHRRLMRVYGRMGNRDGALRQFHLCQNVLRRELDLAPQQETIVLYRELLADRITAQTRADDTSAGVSTSAGAAKPPRPRPFVGRDELLAHLLDQLTPSQAGRPGLILITGEAGVGKTRLAEEFAHEAERASAVVISAGHGPQANHFTCGPFALALENYVAHRAEAERQRIALRYPALARCLPSLPMNGQRPADVDLHSDLAPAIVRLLSEVADGRPLVLALGDVEEFDCLSCDLLRYITHLAFKRPWLIIGATRDKGAEPLTELERAIVPMVQDGLCSLLELGCLDRNECDELVRELLSNDAPKRELLDRIWTGSRGNPLFIEELVEQLGDGAEVGGRAASRTEVPTARPRVRGLVTRRLSQADERLLTLAAATSATEVSLEELRMGAAALDPPISGSSFFESLDRALQMGLLEERGEGFGFRHGVVRSALYEGLPRHRRAELQAVLARPRGASSRRLRVAATT